MNRSLPSIALRAGLAVAGVLAVSVAPAMAADYTNCGPFIRDGVRIELSNPKVGDQVQTGGYVLQGIAYDLASTNGSGISQVALNLDGVNLGNATLGAPNPQASSGPFANAGFTSTVQFPTPNTPPGEMRTLVATAYATSGGSVSFSIPIALGSVSSSVLPSPTTCPSMSSSGRPASEVGLTTVPGTTSGTTSTSGGTTTPAPAPAPAPASNPAIAADGQTLATQSLDTQALFIATFGANAAVNWAQQHNAAIGANVPAPAPAAPAPSGTTTAPATATTTTTTSTNPVLVIQSPHAGDVLLTGGYAVPGVVYNPQTGDQSGIQRVQVWLGDRNSSGTLLGEAKLGLPNPGGMTAPNANDGFQATIALNNTNLNVSSGSINVTLYVYADSSAGPTTLVKLPVTMQTQ